MKKLRNILCILFSALLTVFATIGCSAVGYTVFPSVAAFSDSILFSAQIMGGRAEYAHERMINIIEEIDAQVSATRRDSDLYTFNSAEADTPVEVGEYMYELFTLSAELYEITSGAFDPTLAPLSELWHVDAQSLSQLISKPDGTHVSPDLPSPEKVKEVRALCDMSHIMAEERNGKYYLTKTADGVKLDFGAVAKGYAVDKCIEVLDEYDISSALIDISGNAYFYGERISNGSSGEWNVGVAAPRPRNAVGRGYVCALSIEKNSSAATSGDYNRYYIHDGSEPVFVPHIIGKNGAPIGLEWDGSASEWKNTGDGVISATVIGPRSAVCDALSTAVAALGLEESAALLQKTGYKGLIFTEKEYTIVGNVTLYKPDVYNGIDGYGYHEL